MNLDFEETELIFPFGLENKVKVFRVRNSFFYGVSWGRIYVNLLLDDKS